MHGQGRGSNNPNYQSYQDYQNASTQEAWSSSQQQQGWGGTPQQSGWAPPHGQMPNPPAAYPQQQSHTVHYSNAQPGYNTWGFNAPPGGAYGSGQAGSYAQQGTSGAYGHGSQQYPQGYSGNPTAQQQWSNTSSGYGVQPPPHSASQASGEIHTYVALPSTPQSTIDSYIKIVRLPEDEPASSTQATARSLRAYECTVQGCEKTARGEVFKSKDNARVHVHKHFGSDKLFQCAVATCKKTFASEDAAKRHRDTTDSKAFACATCGSVFARKDYRDWHHARCVVPRS